MAQERSPSPAKSEAKEVDAEIGRKVFFGNLSFSTTSESLTEFGKGCGNVTRAVIITRGPRSLGYGFLTYETEAEAEKAVAELDKKELDGRTINCELAKPQDQLESRPRSGGYRGRGRGGYRGRGRRFRGRGGYYRGQQRDGEGEQQEAARIDDQPGEEQGEEGEATDRPQGRGYRGRRGFRGRGRGGRGRGRGRAPKGEPEGEDSDTLIFCGNLPWQLTDNDLRDMFKDYDVQGAVVSRLRNGKSKGFGFVKLGNKEKQEQVLNNLKNITVDGRELTIKVAKKIQELALEKPAEGEETQA